MQVQAEVLDASSESTFRYSTRVGLVTDAEEAFGGQVLGFELGHEFFESSKLRVGFLRGTALLNLAPSFFSEALHSGTRCLAFKVALDLDYGAVRIADSDPLIWGLRAEFALFLSHLKTRHLPELLKAQLL